MITVLSYYQISELSLKCKLWQVDNLAAQNSGLIGADSDTSPVGRLHGARPRLPVVDKRSQELVDQVGVGPAVPRALHEREVVGVLNAPSKLLDLRGQQVGKVGHGDAFWDLALRLLGGVHNVLLPLHQRPLKGLLGAVDIERLAILARRVKEGSPDMSRKVRPLNLDMATLDGVRAAGLLRQILADRAGTDAGHVLGFAVDQAKNRTYNVSGVLHGDDPFPVGGPALHVLWVGGLQELYFAKFPRVIELLDVEELPAVDNSLSHHVLEASLLDQLADLSALLNRGGHRDRADHVLAGFEGGDGHGAVVWYRRVDVDKVSLARDFYCRNCWMICNLNLRIGKHILKARVALSNIELVTDLIQLGLCPLTY